MSDGIRASCSHCGAKYRLPAEAAGRSARCKKCGEKFEIPRAKTLEDSVLDWLGEPETDEEVAERPRVISMPKEDADDSRLANRGVIRFKGSQGQHQP